MKNLYKVVENQGKYFDLLLNREMVRKTVKKEAALIELCMYIVHTSNKGRKLVVLGLNTEPVKLV